MKKEEKQQLIDDIRDTVSEEIQKHQCPIGLESEDVTKIHSIFTFFSILGTAVLWAAAGSAVTGFAFIIYNGLRFALQ